MVRFTGQKGRSIAIRFQVQNDYGEMTDRSKRGMKTVKKKVKTLTVDQRLIPPWIPSP